MVIWLIPSPFLVHMVYEWPFEQMVLWSMDWVYQDTRRGTAVSGGLNLEVTGTKNTQKNPIQTPQGERKSDWSKNHFCGNMQRIWLRRTLIESVTNYPLFLFAHRAGNHFYPKKRSSFIPLLFMNKQPKCDIVL